MNLRYLTILSLIFAALTTACGGSTAPAIASTAQASQPAEVAATEQPDTDTPLKNLIVMIGDGMGSAHVAYLLDYAEFSEAPIWGDRSTAFMRMGREGAVGISRTSPADAIVVDSACSATQLASGVPALGEVIGLNTDGDAADTVLLAAARSGRATGLVTDTRITHATPAAFAAHVAHRTMEHQIASHMLGYEVDVLLSGGTRYFLPTGIEADSEITGGAYEVSGTRADGRNLLEEAQEAGYTLAFTRDQMLASQSGRLLGLFTANTMDDAIADFRTRGDADRTVPTLREMSMAAIQHLEQSEDGFFLMIEGGQIDWAAHINDAGTLLHEMIAFDEAIKAVMEWAEGRDDTLIVVTADHETGGFGFSYSGIGQPEPVELDGNGFTEHPYHPEFNFARRSLLDRLQAQTMSYREIITAVHAAPEEERAALLMELVNEHTDFPISLEDAQNIMRTTENTRRVEHIAELRLEEMPLLYEYNHPFYPYYMDGHMGALAALQSAQSNVRWSTATHTHAPVPVFAWGSPHWAQRFAGLHHHTELGQLFFEVLGLEAQSIEMP